MSSGATFVGMPDEEHSQQPTRRLGTLEGAAILLLPLGGFLLLIGWFVGVFCLWRSKAWTTPQKWLGTLVIPGGLAAIPFLFAAAGNRTTCHSVGGVEHCTHHSMAPLLITIALVVASIATAVYLASSARA